MQKMRILFMLSESVKVWLSNQRITASLRPITHCSCVRADRMASESDSSYGGFSLSVSCSCYDRFSLSLLSLRLSWRTDAGGRMKGKFKKCQILILLPWRRHGTVIKLQGLDSGTNFWPTITWEQWWWWHHQMRPSVSLLTDTSLRAC